MSPTGNTRYVVAFITCHVLLFIVVGIPIIVYRLKIKPREPTFTLDYATITGFNLTSDDRLTSLFNVVIRANNPNHKLKLKYRNVMVSIYKDKQLLAFDPLPGFIQRIKNVTMLRAEPIALDVALSKGPAFDFKFESGIGYLDFDVFMEARLNKRNLEVNCRHAVVNLAAPAIIAVSSPSSNDDDINQGPRFQSIGCSVHIYSDQSDNNHGF